MATTSIVFILALYAALFFVIQGLRRGGIRPEERKTYWLVGFLWAISVFVGNYAFYKIGIMSFIPWINNALHTFLWIGLVLGYLYMSTRSQRSIWRQSGYFIVFSFIVKYAEQMLFGIWEHDHFFWVFKGNFAYVLGWSIMDGIFPFLTNLVFRILGRFIPGLILVK